MAELAGTPRNTIACYATHSRFTDPGALASWLDSVGPDLADIRAAAARMVFHYWANGDIAQHGFAPERFAEINLRYADAMFARLHELSPAPLAAGRAPTERVVGCCRDYTLVFVAMARHHGIPARARVGFATYLIPGWALDHVVAEVWDGSRWRLVEPQFDERDDIDLLDVPRDRFLVGADAWLLCRAGELDPERCTVAPDVPEEFLRGWPYLTHNLVHDLAALNKHEMLLWDLWGLLGNRGTRTAEVRPKLDALANLLRTPDLGVDQLAKAFDDPDLGVPGVVTSASPPGFDRTRVTLRTS